MSSQAAASLKMQRRFTVTLGISCFFTILLYILPVSAQLVSVSSNQTNENIAFIIPYMFIISNVNAIMNFFIYTSRHKDIRLAVKCLFTCEELTPMMLKENTHKNSVAPKSSVRQSTTRA